MHTFHDSTGQPWAIAINIATVKRVKSTLTEIDLLEVGTGEPPLIVRLQTDVILLCDVLYVLCKPEADARGVTDEKFGELMGGDGLLNARTALMAEITDFFQKLGRTEQATIVTQADRYVRATIAAASERVQTFDVEALSRKVVGKLFTDAQASLDSIPTHSPSGN